MKSKNLTSAVRQAVLSALGQPELANVIVEGTLLHKDVTIPTADVLTLYTTAYELIPAPGAGNCILVEGVYATIDYASATYSAGSNTLDVRYTNSSGDLVAQLTNAFLTSSADGRAQADMQAETVPVVNAAVVAHVPSANPTTGDSDIKVRVYYRIVPSLL